MQKEELNIKNRGITLISLVITIIVLIILLGTTIAITLSGNGLIFYASEASEKTRATEMQEQIDLEISKNISAKHLKLEMKSKEELVQQFIDEGKLTEEEAKVLETQDTIEIAGIVVNFSSLNNEGGTTKVVGNGKYLTLAECIEDANEGDKIVIAKTIADEKIVVNKSLKITSPNKRLLNNTTITADGEDVELKISNLSFSGKSYINANNAKTLVVENVTADVTLDSTDSVTNSRAAFISLGTPKDDPLLLKVINSDIVVTGNASPDPILGWRHIADGSLISGNKFGAEGKANWEAIKLMNFMNNATVTIKNNIAYVSGNGFALSQTTSRNNTYTAIIEGNTFIGSGVDYIWVEMSGTGSNILANIIANNNKVSDVALEISDIKSDGKKLNYAVVDLKTNEEGKIVGGTYSSLTSDEYIEYVRENIAEGYTLETNSDGSYVVTRTN